MNHLYKCRRCGTFWSTNKSKPPREFAQVSAYQKACDHCRFTPGRVLEEVAPVEDFRGMREALEPLQSLVRVLAALVALVEAGKAVGRIFAPDAAVFAPWQKHDQDSSRPR